MKNFADSCETSRKFPLIFVLCCEPWCTIVGKSLYRVHMYRNLPVLIDMVSLVLRANPFWLPAASEVLHLSGIHTYFNLRKFASAYSVILETCA
jgi:hypothetical protein